MNPNPVYAQHLAATKKLKNARKNQIGGWVFFGLGALATLAGMITGQFRLLWLLMGVVGLLFALDSGRRMTELKAAVATAGHGVAQAQSPSDSPVSRGQFGGPRAAAQVVDRCGCRVT